MVDNTCPKCGAAPIIINHHKHCRACILCVECNWSITHNKVNDGSWFWR